MEKKIKREKNRKGCVSAQYDEQIRRDLNDSFPSNGFGTNTIYRNTVEADGGRSNNVIIFVISTERAAAGV